VSARPPVIIIGMHRSGTTMVTRMLQELGLFVGAKTDENWEPPFFRHVNDWLLTQCGGRWDHPEPIRDLIDSPRVRELVTDYLKSYVNGPRAASFFGLRGLRRRGREAIMSGPWGWKDPRNTFTLPLWLDVFPRAKVIHIYRHGIDVANSLARRWKKSIEKRSARFDSRRRMYAIRPQSGGFAESYRCGTLEGALMLWEEYVNEARRHVSAMGEAAFEIQYESFLDDPAKALVQLAAFARLGATREQIMRTAGGVKRERAYAYREENGLVQFAHEKAARLAACGYSA
jgi:hypothetical protein